MKQNILSTNFLIASIVLVASLFSINQDIATNAVGAIVGAVGVFAMVREAIKGAKVRSFGNMVTDPNTWTHLSAVVGFGVPALSVVVEPLHELALAITAGSFPGILKAAIALVAILFYTIRDMIKSRSNIPPPEV